MLLKEPGRERQGRRFDVKSACCRPCCKLRKDRTSDLVDDIVAGLVAAIDAGLEYEVVNLGCGRPVENLEFVRVLEQLLGREAIIQEVPAPPSEPLITFADTSKAQRLLGYQPKVNVEEGLRRFVEWMRGENLIS